VHAKVLTGRQKPLTEIAFLFAEIETEKGHSGIGFSIPSAQAARADMRTSRKSPAN
jgi:hypothetical protein